MDVAAAFKNFFEGRLAGRKTGYPKFKSKKRSRQSFYLANDKFTVGDHRIDVPKLGRVNMAESLRLSGKILSARISTTGSRLGLRARTTPSIRSKFCSGTCW